MGMDQSALQPYLDRLHELGEDDLADVQKLFTALAQSTKREKAQGNFLDFVYQVWPDFIHGKHHEIMANAFDRVAKGHLKRLIINLPPRHELPLHCPILTTIGWKTIGTLEVGDYVFGPDGQPTMVSGFSPVRHDEEVWEVETSDGHIVECSSDHLWTISSRTTRAYRCWKTMSTEAISEANYRHGPVLPDFKAIQMPYKDLPIDPYVLGVWLGDGSKDQSSVGCSFADMAASRSLIEDCGYRTTHNPKYQQYNILGLNKQLRENNLLKNKHIPEAYFLAHEEQRIALLQGLIDTDGSVGKNGRVAFYQTPYALVEQVCTLINGLGVKARIISRRETTNGFPNYKGNPGKLSYRINFHHQNAARLLRKSSRLQPIRGNFSRTISIKKTDRYADMRCIRVCRDDGLFLVGRGMVVTHNTKSEFASNLLPAWYLGKFPKNKIIQASHTADLSKDFGKKVKDLIEDPKYLKIFPDMGIKKDDKAVGRWKTNHKGEYYAVGVGGNIAGRGANLFIIDDPHPLDVNELVLTTVGYKTVSEIEVGDYVFSPSGKPIRVSGKSPVYEDRELFRAICSDGSSVLCDKDHLWTVRNTTNRNIKNVWKTVSTSDLIDWQKKHSTKSWLPDTSSVDLPHKDLPIDPYVLGAWLGDGTSSLGRMTAHPDDASEMRAMFQEAGYETTDLVDPYSFGVLKFRRELIDHNLLNNKHIPESYLIASESQRIKLLQGLMDTDGTVSSAGQCSFDNSNLTLVKDVQTLLNTLGFHPTIRSIEDHRERWGSSKTMFRLNFKFSNAFSLKRKRERAIDVWRQRTRTIEIEETGMVGSTQCITVEGGESLFLAGRGLIPTHNSEQTVAANEKVSFDKVYEWYTSGPRQRLQPDAAIVVVMCMTGDTPILMSDGSEKALRDISVGEVVATYKSAAITTSRINNFRSSGVDSVYRITTDSGRTVKANRRHPFLVDDHGELKWVRLSNLNVGDSLVSTKAAKGHYEEPLSTLSVSRDRIFSIEYVGEEEVFDVEVDETENFIANGLVSHNTRWSKVDLTGRILKKAKEDGELSEWEVIELPAIMENGKPLWPEYWSLRELQKLKKELSNQKWSAQYMQQPAANEASIIKREWWKPWTEDQPPKCEFIMQSWDTGFLKSETADPSAFTEWGVFYTDGANGNPKANLILLNAFRKRMEFPELKKEAWRRYNSTTPDTVIIEGKSSGMPLVQELRARGIPIQTFVPTRGNDKIARVNAVSDMFSEGIVWYPEGKSFAQEVIDEFSDFPVGNTDDLVDSSTQALLRFRQGGFIQLETDYEDDEEFDRRRINYY